MELHDIISLDKKYHMNTFGDRTALCFTHGNGMLLYSNDGRSYVDLLAGIAVSALGHAHPALVEAITLQASKYLHCSNLYYNEPQAKLARLLVEISCADRVFFANSGAEANEGAIKLARIYSQKSGHPERYNIITFDNSFHGRTLATTNKASKIPAHATSGGFAKTSQNTVPLNNLPALEEAIDSNTCAVMLEPIQGESGVNPADSAWLHGVRKLCDANGILLIFDEVQCGLGRTGKMFGYEHYGVEPDIFTLAKALGSGFPIGALLAKEFVAMAFEPGEHGSTFGGNPLACAAGLATVDTIISADLVGNSARMGEYLLKGLKVLSCDQPLITEVRGMGLMIGIQLGRPIARDILSRCQTAGFLVGRVGDSIIRLLPPLIICKADIDKFLKSFSDILRAE